KKVCVLYVCGVCVFVFVCVEIWEKGAEGHPSHYIKSTVFVCTYVFLCTYMSVQVFIYIGKRGTLCWHMCTVVYTHTQNVCLCAHMYMCVCKRVMKGHAAEHECVTEYVCNENVWRNMYLGWFVFSVSE